jgi:hypothetical protein
MTCRLDRSDSAAGDELLGDELLGDELLAVWSSHTGGTLPGRRPVNLTGQTSRAD